MANNVGNGNSRVIIDVDGEAATVTGNRLDVNAYLSAGSVNVGDIDVLSVIPGTGATNLGKAEDAGHTGEDVGVMALAVRRDSVGTFASSNEDYAPLQVTNIGELRVNMASSVGASEALNTGGQPRSATQRGPVVLAVRNDELAISSAGHADGDYTYLQVDAEGALYTTHGITGMTQGITTVAGTAMQLDEGTDGYDIPCKRVDLMSRHDNVGIIYVGSADTIASNGSVGGIRLNAGDFYSMDINNLNHIWVEATIADQELIFIYYT